MRYTSIAFAVLLSFASSPAFSQFDNLLRGMKKLAGELEKGQQAPSAPPQQQQPQPQQAQQPQPQPTPVGVASDQENSFVKCANPELTFGGACLGTISKGINAYLTGGTGSSNLGEFGDQFKKLGVLLSQKNGMPVRTG